MNRPVPTAPTTGEAPVDLLAVREALLRDGPGPADAAFIDSLLGELMDERFRHARVPTFVPIFLYRAAREVLAARGGRAA